MQKLLLTHIQSLLKNLCSVRMHILQLDTDDLFPLDNGLRRRLDNSALLYEELRQILQQELSDGMILHLQDPLCLHYVVFPLEEVCVLGPFVTEASEENHLLMHLRKEFEIPHIAENDMLAATQNLLRITGQLHDWPVKAISLHMDPALLVQLTSGQYVGAHEVVRRVVYYIQAHLHAKLTLESLAEHVGFSPTYISHHFKDEMGMPPMQYITRQRMQYAQYLLRSTNRPIHEIASNIGISDWSYFTKRFREFTGFTPTEYRNQYK